MAQTFHIRKAKVSDLDNIYKIMKTAKETVHHPDWFVDEDRDFIEEHLEEQGFVLVAETAEEKIAAFFMVTFPGDSQENLGLELGFSEEKLSLVAHMDSVGVLPEYRGNRLHDRLQREAERLLKSTNYRYLLCTVHPENRFSLNNVMGIGYKIGNTIRTYGDLPRHVLMKDLQKQKKKAILVSACLLGVSCRYNGQGEFKEDIFALRDRYELIPVCPEILGGLSTPRIPCERVGDLVVNKEGQDKTAEFMRGAKETLKLAKLYDCEYAILKERSPSCGKGKIYDGSHTKTLLDGDGITAELLEINGITVIGESNIEIIANL